jgi:hypothetical protein
MGVTGSTHAGPFGINCQTLPVQSRRVVVVRSGEGFAAVDVQGLAGEERVGQGE